MKQYAIAVLGSGAWGTALAIHLAKKMPVCLWGRAEDVPMQMQSQRTNEKYLPNIPFPERLHVEPCLEKALADAEDILIAVPSHAFGSLLSQMKPFLILDTQKIVWATKGLDPKTHRLLHEVVKDILGPSCVFAVLSGPSFAREVAEGLPTAVSLASGSLPFLEKLVDLLHSEYFRTYTTYDYIGVQVCAVVKNVLAIAVGISDGMHLGANARAALITRGLAEMTRLGLAMGGILQTFLGLAGVGDLVLTCTDNQSRNRRFGLALGGAPDLAKDADPKTIEGKMNAEEVYLLAKVHHVEMPITERVHAILTGTETPEEAMRILLSRPVVGV